MKTKMEQFTADNPNPVLNVAKDGTILYSNTAGEPLLHEWSAGVGEKLPFHIRDFVQRVISRNGPEKIEVKVGKRVYLVTFYPLPEEECVNIYGFYISDHKEIEEQLRESEAKYRGLFETVQEVFYIDRLIYDEQGNVVDWIFEDLNPAGFELLGLKDINEAKGKRGSEVLGREVASFYLPMIEKARQSSKAVTFQYHSPYIDREFLTSYVICGDRLISSHMDVTERKQMEEALKKAHDSLEIKVRERTAELEKAYKSLEESEKGLDEAQKMAHIGNWEWDIATDKAYWSDELYHIFGRNPQELAPPYNEYLSYVHPDDRDYADNAHKKALNGKPFSIDHRIILANGEERIVHIQSETIFNEENIPVRIKGIVQDITERKKSEEEIQVLANIVESSNDAIGTLSLDGIITSWNRGAEQVYGYSAKEILGKAGSTLASPHLSEETKKLTEMVKQGEKILLHETSRLRKNGKIIDVSITLSPVFDSHGKLTAVSFISRDITERKRAEEKLQESEERFRNIVETANEGILITDNENIMTYVNKKFADMLRYAPEEVIGRPIWSFISEEYKPIVKMNLENRRQGISESYELKLIRKDNSPLWILLNAKPIFDNDSKYIGAMSMLTDITTRKEAEEAFANIEITRKKEIHHRIKNNLQVISSLLDLQAEKFKNREDIKDSEVLEAFRESQDRVISMALIHEELYKGGGFDTLNFSPYIEELTENLFLTYRLGNIDISLNMELEDNLFFDVDTAVPLGIIVNELVSNSLKHAFSGRDKGEIRIKLHRGEKGECKNEGCRSTSFTLTVSDNGIGISETLDLENPDSLGIQLVTSLVDQLDGELELKRNNGTEFTIRFTVTEKNNQASASQQLIE